MFPRAKFRLRNSIVRFILKSKPKTKFRSEFNHGEVASNLDLLQGPEPFERLRRSTASLTLRSSADTPRPRTTFTDDQVQLLEESFKRSQIVSLEERTQLALQLGVAEENVDL